MFSRFLNAGVWADGLTLAGWQLLAALPWLWAIDPKGFRRVFLTRAGLGTAAGVLFGGVAAAAVILTYKSDSTSLFVYGRYAYGAALHLQLLIDLFILLPLLLVAVWPKGGAVAYAAYREAWRQPTFWLILNVAVDLTWLAVVIPYFTFGDDYKMMKQIGFDVIMVSSVLFGVLAAAMSISEEIEGRTAITLLSKPVNRRQFLIGKFLGIMMACLALTLVLGWNLNYALRVFPEYDKINEVTDSMAIQADQALTPQLSKTFYSPPGLMVARGMSGWFADTLAHSFGIALGFGQVMILVAISSALATRIPFVVNIVLCLIVYMLGHLALVVVRVTSGGDGSSTGRGLIGFLGQLFDVLLPALEFFNMGPAIIRERPLDLWQFATYVSTVFGYSIIYTAIALIVGLLLFEDRDLA